jgi:hypothetical protein
MDRIASRGPTCAAIAQKGRELLAAGQITFFVWQEGNAGGYGHRNTGIQIEAAYPQLYDEPNSSFEKVLVHEIEHVLGFGHVDNAGLHTPHCELCG